MSEHINKGFDAEKVDSSSQNAGTTLGLNIRTAGPFEPKRWILYILVPDPFQTRNPRICSSTQMKYSETWILVVYKTGHLSGLGRK